MAAFFKQHRGAKVASTALMDPMSHAFVKSIHDFATREGVEIVAFAKGERKDDVAKQRLAGFAPSEGVLFISKTHSPTLRPGLSQQFNGCPNAPKRPIASAMLKLDQALGALFNVQ